MNLGDGLKLETELLDGRTKLILSPYERKSEISVKIGNKTKIAKCPQRTKQTGRILKSTQNTCVRSEKCVQKKGIGSETSLAKSEKDKMTFLLAKDLCKRYGDNDYVHIQRGILPTTPNRKKTRSPVTCSVAQQKLCRNHVTPEDWKSSLVCLTQDQLQQILMTVNQGSRSVSVTESGKEETSQYNIHFNNSPNQPKDESIVGLLQKSEAVSSVLDENKSVLNKKQETSKHLEQKVTIENVWKPADIFSTLGERERDRSLLEAKKAQWRKELDEQVALKKKEKEASEKWNNNPWKKSESDKIVWEKPHALDQPQTSSSSSSILSPSRSQAVAVPADGDSVVRAAQNLEEAVLPESPVSAGKEGPQTQWTQGPTEQVGEDQPRRLEAKTGHVKAEDYDRWAVHFDSFRSYPGSQPPQPSQSACNQPEYLCVSPDPQELADISSTCAPTDGSQLGPAEEKPTTRPTGDGAGTHGQKTNFLRSMTALLDPAQIEERDRRRQKQLEHQKAITAQVEEKRRRRQLEEEQRREDEEEDERRLAREREALQRQLQEELRKQKQKEEIMTLKTEELLQAMQRAQELAQKRRQEQRIRDLAQKGHDTSRLLRNLGAGTMQMEHGASTGSSSERGLGPDAAREGTCASYTTLPKKDTAVQTDDFGAGMLSAESRCRPALERQTVDSPSPETPADFSGQSYTEKNEQELTEDKGANLDKEDSWHNDHCSQVTGAEKPTKHRRKCLKRPDWNINKPLKRYIPASAKYPRQLQKQREENRVRRQMELLRLVERNHHGHLSCSRGASPEAAPVSHGDTESRLWGYSVKKEEPLTVPPFSRESRSQSSPVPVTTTRTQQSPTNTLYLSLKNGNYERENLISEVNHTESSPATSELSHFIPYVRTDEIYYLDPDAPLSRPSTQDAQDPSSHDQDPVGDPLLNPHLIRNRDRQQAILKGLSDLRQGLLQKQKELETNLMPVATNQEENFSSLF